MRTPWSQKNNIIWPSFKRQFNTAVSGDNTVRKAVPYLDRYQQEQLERQQERQKRWEKQIHKRAVQKEFEERRRRANALTFAEASVVGVLCAVLLFACIFYVGQQAKLNQSNTKLASLQKNHMLPLLRTITLKAVKLKGQLIMSVFTITQSTSWA